MVWMVERDGADGPLWVTVLSLSWGGSLWWSWSHAKQVTRALEGVMTGESDHLPDEFEALSRFLQASRRQQQGAEASYRQALQRVDIQRRLLASVTREGLSEVDLVHWGEALRSSLEPTLHPRELHLWVQDGEDYHWRVGPKSPGRDRRGFAGEASCWVETTAEGVHHFFLRVSPILEASPDLPLPVLVVVELVLEPTAENTSEIRERLESVLPLLSVSWANWTLSQELVSRARLSRNVIDSLEDGVLLVDLKGQVLSQNPAARRLFGKPLEGLALDTFLSLPESRSWASCLLEQRVPPSFEAHLTRTGQAPVEAFILNYPVASKLTSLGGPALTVVVRDVTKQRELENLRSDFTATLSHELRTPLTSMKGYLQTLMHRKARSFDMDKVQSIVTVINGQADQLQRLIQELLEAAKMRSQDLEIRPRPVEMAELLKECLEENPNKKVQQELNTQPCCAYCDPERVRSVLEHLLSNAHKYSLPGGRVEVGCARHESSIRVWVKDEGVGIPLEQQEKIFEMYHRLDTGNQRTHYGVGIGLYIARKVVEGHGGAITVESAPGCGSTFQFTLPALEDPEK